MSIGGLPLSGLIIAVVVMVIIYLAYRYLVRRRVYVIESSSQPCLIEIGSPNPSLLPISMSRGINLFILWLMLSVIIGLAFYVFHRLRGLELLPLLHVVLIATLIGVIFYVYFSGRGVIGFQGLSILINEVRDRECTYFIRSSPEDDPYLYNTIAELKRILGRHRVSNYHLIVNLMNLEERWFSFARLIILGSSYYYDIPMPKLVLIEHNHVQGYRGYVPRVEDLSDCIVIPINTLYRFGDTSPDLVRARIIDVLNALELFFQAEYSNVDFLNISPVNFFNLLKGEVVIFHYPITDELFTIERLSEIPYRLIYEFSWCPYVLGKVKAVIVLGVLPRDLRSQQSQIESQWKSVIARFFLQKGVPKPEVKIYLRFLDMNNPLILLLAVVPLDAVTIEHYEVEVQRRVLLELERTS